MPIEFYIVVPALKYLTQLFATVLVVDSNGRVNRTIGNPLGIENLLADETVRPLHSAFREALQGHAFEGMIAINEGTFRVRAIPTDAGLLVGFEEPSRPVFRSSSKNFAGPEVEFLVQNMRQGLWRLAPDGRIQAANEWLATWLETTVDEMTISLASRFVLSRDGDPEQRHEATFLTATGEERRAIISSAALLSPKGRPRGQIEIITDITAEHAERKSLVQEVAAMARLARTDILTGLGNRMAFEEALHAVNQTGEPYGLIVTDADAFKAINDVFGHEAGDDVLREIAFRLRNCVRRGDVVVRLGGDEFAILLPSTSKSILMEIADRLRKQLVFTLRAGIHVEVSIGAAHRDDFETDVLNAADQAMYRAKRARREHS